MRNSLVILIFVITWLCSCGPTSNYKTGEVAKINNRQRSLIHDLEKASGYRYIYTDTTYASSTGKGITIQNSGPKGGMIEPDGKQYIDSWGKRYGFTVFWTRIINETTTPFELNINFPADSFAIFKVPDSYLKLFLPTDTMTYDKLSWFNYGLTGIKPFLDTNFNKATKLQKTINPNEDHIFYVAALIYQYQPAGGMPTAEFILKEQDLYYNMSLASHGYGIIPCGKIAFRN